MSPQPPEGGPVPGLPPRRGLARRTLGALLATAWWGVKLAAFLLGAAAVALLAALLTVNRAFEESEVVVPDVAGLTLAEAAEALERADLAVRVEARRPHDTVDEGRVFYQEPLAGQSSRRGRQVAIVLSTGLGRIGVPDLAGQSPRAAVLALRALGLELGDVVRVHEARARSGDIFAQDPPPGSPVREGAQVQVLASLGPWPRTFVMPDLRGRSLSRVEALLASVGIRIAEVRQQVVPGQPAGLVHEQLPPAGTPVRSDAAVSLVVTHQVEQPVREMRRRPRLFTE